MASLSSRPPGEPAAPDLRATTESELLSQHQNDPLAALGALVARYNDLVRQHATLQFEKQAAEKAAERSAIENQQLWRSFKSIGNTGTSPRPAGVRQNSEGASSVSRGTGPVGATLRRGLSSELQNGRLETPAPPLPQGSLNSPEGASSPTSPSTFPPTSPPLSARSKTATPPPMSPRILSRSASHTSLRKASSLDLGRGLPPSGIEIHDLDVPIRQAVRYFLDPKSLTSPRFPTSASMPSISTDRSEESSTPTGAQFPPNTPTRRLLPSIVPVSPFQISHDRYDENGGNSPGGPSASPTSPLPPSQLQLPTSAEVIRRMRSSSNNSSLSQVNGVDDRAAMKMAPLAENVGPIPSGLPQPEPEPEPHAYSGSPSSFSTSALLPPLYHSPGPSPFESVPRASSSARKTQPQPPPPTPALRPTLSPAFLPFSRVRVPSSSIRTNEKGKEVISFIVDVAVHVPPDVDPDRISGAAEWRVEKLYSDVLALDSTIKSKASKQESKSIASLPDKSLFKDHAPHKSDQRKAVLERYLQTLLTIPLRDRTAVCAFFNSDVMAGTAVSSPASGAIEGWLTKRGRNFGGWQTRYYILMGDTLSYYDTREGSKLGEISLHHAAIGRQSSRTSEAADDSYLHAFLIRTTTKGKDDKEQDADHILCAESDEARDSWIVALTNSQNAKLGPRAQGSFSIDRERGEPADGRTSPEDPRRLHNRQRSGSLTGQASDDPTRQGSRRTPSSDIPPSMSMPASLDLMALGESNKLRTTSEHGRFPEYRGRLQPPASRREVERNTKSSERPATPDRRPSDGNPKIATSQVSGPMNAAPLPSGYEFKKADRSKKTKSSFWNFAGRSNGADKAAAPAAVPHTPSRPVFGVPLKEAVAVSRIRPGLELPAVVYRCVEYLEAKNAESEEGIFRLSGSANVIRVLKDRFNAEGDVQLLHSAEYYDPHAIAGLLKAFLRELPVHILTRELHPEFLQVIDLRNRKDRVNALGKLVARLPIEEYTLFRFFFAHLCVIAQNHEVSKMNLRNLGIVFSPTLAIPAPLFSLLLSEFDLVFAVEKETGLSRPIMVDDLPSEPEPEQERRTERRARPNSELYERSGAPLLMEEGMGRGVRLQEHDEDSEQDSELEDVPEPDPTFASNTFLPLPLPLPLPSSQPASPRTPTFKGLPPSPRPGQTFATQMTA